MAKFELENMCGSAALKACHF